MTITDRYRCTAVASVTVEVVDVRYHKNNNKVLVAHYAGKSGRCNTLCISADDVADHLAHGDALGSCPSAKALFVEAHKVYPNPFSSTLNVDLKPEVNDHIIVEIYDATGRLIATPFNDDVEGGIGYPVEVEASSFPAGILIVTITSNAGTQNYRIVHQ